MNLILKQALMQVNQVRVLGDQLTAAEAYQEESQDGLDLLKPLMTNKGQKWLIASGLKLEYDRQLENLELRFEKADEIREKFEKVDKLVQLMPVALLKEIEKILEEEAEKPVVSAPQLEKAGDSSKPVKPQNASLKFRPLLKEFDQKYTVPSQRGRCEDLLNNLEQMDAPAELVETRRSLLIDK